MQIAQIPLILVWTLACHNSIWTFLLGIPFERTLSWHKLLVWLSLGLGLYHGILGQLGKGEPNGTRVTGEYSRCIGYVAYPFGLLYQSGCMSAPVLEPRLSCGGVLSL